MSKDKFEIDLDELKQEAKNLFLCAERDRITPKPMQRLGQIIEALHRYQRAVVKANVPRAFNPKSLSGREKRDLLRQHRETHQTNPDPETGITALRDWLKTLDCAFVLADELYWRLDDCDWEAKVWRPIYEWAERGYEMLFGGPRSKDWPLPVDVAVLSAWQNEEQDLDYRLFGKMTIFIPEPDNPVVESREQFTIRWRGYLCHLGDTDGFTIMKRLIESRNKLVSRENIGRAIGNDDYSDEALRQAARRLRIKLTEAGLGELAKRIKTGENGKCIYLDQSSLDRPGRV